jgi:hypothetical protein
VQLVLPDNRQAVCPQRVEAVVDGDFSRALMGIMSFSCFGP